MKTDSFGSRLKNLRLKRNMTVVDFAEQIAVPGSTYAEWEAGRQIQGEPYLRIAKACQISLHELFTGGKPQANQLAEKFELIEGQFRDLKIQLLSFL